MSSPPVIALRHPIELTFLAKRKDYDSMAPTYKDLARLEIDARRNLVQEAALRADSIVVDFACGDGLTACLAAPFLSAPAEQLYLVDRSHGMIQEANKLVGRCLPIDRVAAFERDHVLEKDLTVASTWRLLEQKPQFSHILIYDWINHISRIDRKAFLGACLNVLAPGGKVVCEVACDSPDDPEKPMLGFARQIDIPSYHEYGQAKFIADYQPKTHSVFRFFGRLEEDLFEGQVQELCLGLPATVQVFDYLIDMAGAKHEVYDNWLEDAHRALRRHLNAYVNIHGPGSENDHTDAWKDEFLLKTIEKKRAAYAKGALPRRLEQENLRCGRDQQFHSGHFKKVLVLRKNDGVPLDSKGSEDYTDSEHGDGDDPNDPDSPSQAELQRRSKAVRFEQQPSESSPLRGGGVASQAALDDAVDGFEAHTTLLRERSRAGK